MRRVIFLKWPIALFALSSCGDTVNQKSTTRFRLVPEARSGVDFVNQLDYTEELNTYTFRNFYNGGGVGIGDLNNDGLPEIFFSGNMVSNRLYLNKGNLRFQDITDSAGLNSQGSWSTGVSFADINGDGLLDIYVCKSGPPGGVRRHNELFINNGDLTFTERAAEYGLAFKGLSVHAAFFDFDRDGDLDCYLLNNSIRSVGGYDLREGQRNIPDPEGGNKLLRNDEGHFTDITAQAGIYSSAIGFGLGVTIGDIDNDNWPDIFVSNDFFEKDYLYINNRNGTFTESLEECMNEISLGSMGADMADINNDGLPEIFVTEMLPESDERLKTTSQFESWDRHRLSRDKGYYQQYSRNVLQLNNGNGSFSEIGRFAGVHATDWSWGALIFDMDNDGWKDIFVANGIYKDLLDQDYANFIANPDLVREILRKEKNVIKRLIDSIPTNKLPNYAFRNEHDLTFRNVVMEWGFEEATDSNGSAYGDLDNDGDLDLVLNNVNMRSFVYENRSESDSSGWLRITLSGGDKNRFAVGSKVTLFDHGKVYSQELSPMRGFMSSVDYRLQFGVGKAEVMDSVVVTWPDGKVSVTRNVRVNQDVMLSYADGRSGIPRVKPRSETVFVEGKAPSGIDYIHQESDFVDFDRERLLFNMISNEGPCLCTGDIDGDGREDFYIGGAKGQSGEIYVQVRKNGTFEKMHDAVFRNDADSEDTDCVFFDANGDGRMDLYVTSGGVEYSSSSGALLDRLYINKGPGMFEKSTQPFPVSGRFESTSGVAVADYDKDGDLDLFVGVRVVPSLYGVPGNGYILANDGRGVFSDVTSVVAPELIGLGMFTDAVWADVNQDGWSDLIIAGDWMPLTLFINEKGKLTDKSKEFGLANTHGWYRAIEVADVNKDGLPDLVAGNHGLNSRFKAGMETPVRMYVNDFDKNGTVEQIITRYERGISLPFVLRPDLLAQIPSLKKKYLHYEAYKGQTIDDIFTPEQMKGAVVLQAFTMETALWLNAGGSRFEKRTLPAAAGFTPVYAILAEDFDGDGNIDLLMGGNQRRAKPETGIYDAGYGLLLTGDGTGNFETVAQTRAGLDIRGEVRAFRKIRTGSRKAVLVGKNNDRLEIIYYSPKYGNEKM